jgi:hypothetical protein
MGYQLTGCRQHMVTCKHSIRSSHETHCLLVLAKSLPTGRKPDDRRGKDDSCSGDRTEKHMVGNGLRSIRTEREETEQKPHLVVLERCPFDGYKSVHGKRLGMFGHTVDIR